MIELIDLEDESVRLALTREQVKNGPEYDEERYLRADGEFWEPYDDYYGQPPAGFAP